MATTNSSPILRKAKLKNRNKIPNDFYQDDIYVYSILEIVGDEVSSLSQFELIKKSAVDELIKMGWSVALRICAKCAMFNVPVFR